VSSTRTRATRGLVGAALLVGAVTALARVVGFGRTVVFSRTVGATCLGTAYATANQVPNLIFEVVAGGALAGAVVPLLAGPLAAGAREQAGRTVSALLTWTLAVLTPLALLAALAAPVLVRGLLGAPAGCSAPGVVSTAARMLVVFAPQLPLYGVAVVLGGLLQADRRFLGPALAPLASSLVVSSAYLLYGTHRLAAGADVLSVGTTLGVAVLALGLLLPLRGTGLALRPTLRFPAGVAGRARSLAGAGLAGVLAQQLATVTVVVLANRRGGPGAVVLYGYAWALYLLPYAVLAVPVATSAFPVLAGLASAGDRPGYAGATAATTRAVVLVSAAGAALLAGTAGPLARVFVAGAPGAGDPATLAVALQAWAPGLLGYGLLAHLGRALYAAQRPRTAAAATVAGWLGVAVADVALVLALPPERTVSALGLGNALGMTAAGALLVLGLRRHAGVAGLAGCRRAGLAAALGALVATAAGATVAHVLTAPSAVVSAGIALVAGTATVLAYAAVVLLVDPKDLRLVLRRGLPGRTGGGEEGLRAARP